MSDKEILRLMREKLHSIDPDAKLFLFGSRARGDANNDTDVDKRSDWDLLILLDKQTRTTWSDFDKYAYPLTELGWDLGETVSPIVRTIKDWNDNRTSLFNHNVEADAISL